MTLTLRWPLRSYQYHKLLTTKEVGVKQAKKHIYKSDLNLDLMALVLKLDLDIFKVYHHTKNEVSMSRYLKVIA